MDDRLEEEWLPEPANTELSERELEIVRLLATGLSNKEIAAQVYLSVNTVKVHLRNVFAKLNVQTRTEATLIAIQRGWVTVPNSAVPSTPASAEGEASDGSREPIELATTAVDAPPVPTSAPVEIEPPLPLIRRLAFSAIAVIALGLALIISPRGAVQSGSQAQPFSDTPLVGSGVNTIAGDTTWQAQSAMSLARGRLAAAAVGQDLIAIGGETTTGVTGLVEILDTQTQRWSTGQNKPTPVANVSAVVVSGTVIVPGGYTAAGVPTAIVEAYHPLSDTWTTLAPLPAPRFAYAIAAYQTRVYVIGGWDGQRYVDTVFVYDVAESRWESCAPLLVTRGGLGLVSMAGRLYAIGGGWTGYLSFNEWYDPNENQWTVLPTPFVGQWRGLGLTAIGNDLYVLGGWTGQYQTVVEKYNPFPFSIFVPSATR